MAGIVSSSAAADIRNVMIISTDFASDVQAINELKHGSLEVMTNLADIGDSISSSSDFNPLYLPGKIEDPTSMLDLTEENDSAAVIGFPNPFISMEYRMWAQEDTNLIDAKVNFKEFTLPPLEDFLKTSESRIS
jgi:hypothetical protein